MAVNALLLGLIARFDPSVRQEAPPPAPIIVPVDLSQLVLPPRAAPTIPRLQPTRTRPAERPAVKPAQKHEAAPKPVPREPETQAPPPPQPSAAPLQPTTPSSTLSPAPDSASEDATRAKVSTALRGLTGCSMISGPDDEATRERCRRAFTRADVAGVAIEAVPEDKRVGYDRVAAKAEDRRNAVTDIVIPKGGGAGGVARDKGRNINVHYGCWMKFGAGAVPKMHCPGVM